MSLLPNCKYRGLSGHSRSRPESVPVSRFLVKVRWGKAHASQEDILIHFLKLALDRSKLLGPWSSWTFFCCKKQWPPQKWYHHGCVCEVDLPPWHTWEKGASIEELPLSDGYVTMSVEHNEIDVGVLSPLWAIPFLVSWAWLYKKRSWTSQRERARAALFPGFCFKLLPWAPPWQTTTFKRKLTFSSFSWVQSLFCHSSRKQTRTSVIVLLVRSEVVVTL